MSYYKNNNSKKFGAIAVCFVLIGIILCGMMTSWFQDWNPYCWFGHDYDDEGICAKCGYVKLAEDEQQPDEEVIEENNQQLAFATNERGSLRLSAPRRVANTSNIASTDTGSKVITATVDGDATDKSVTWSIAWKDASSTWASGKNISDYITLTPNDAENSVQVDCLHAFGEQAIITCKANGAYNELTATATVDFIKRLVGVNVDCDAVNLADTNTVSSAKTTLTASAVYGVGTIENKDTISVSIDKVDFALSSAIQTGIAGDIESLGSTFYLYKTSVSKTISSGEATVETVVGFNEFLTLTSSVGEVHVKAARGRIYKNVNTAGWHMVTTAHVSVRVNGVATQKDVTLNVPISNTYLTDYTIPDSLTLDIDKIEF